MTAVRWKLAFGLAVLLAATPAAADTVVTAEEVIPCSVESADASFLGLKLPQGGFRVMYTRDIYELRLSDSSRVAELATRLPQLRIILDSGQLVPQPAARAREMLRLRLERTREARAKGFPGYTEVVGPLRGMSPNEMVAKCGDMDFVLRECGRSDETTAGLLREVSCEEKALRMLWLRWTTCLYVSGCGLLGGFIGAVAGALASFGDEPAPVGGALVLALGGAGGVVGSAIGTPIGIVHHRRILSRHRNRVNDLIRRVNHTVTTQP